MSDLIDRQAAIDAAKNWYEGLICGSINGLIKRLNALPSAQPEPSTNCSEFPNNSDTVSRQAAIDAADSETVSTNPEHFKSSEKFIKFMDDDDIASFGRWQWANGFNTALVALKVQLEKLPSAQPEPKEGRWIEGGIYRDVIECYCSECGQLMTTAATVRMNYCPNCGAKMRGEQHETD